jgi:uncharacterized surface protein with fasciclin (FAS1) repeats
MRAIKKLVCTIIVALMALSVNAETKSSTILEVAKKTGQFKTLLAAIDAAGLRSALNGKGPFTVLAPTDKAFSRLPPGTVSRLLKKENRDKLISILKFHVLSGELTAQKLVTNGTAATLEGSKVQASFRQGRLNVNDANVLNTDIVTANGVIHVIDKVLIPEQSLDKTAKIKNLIEIAIDKGVPIFNNGQYEASATIYYICAKSLLSLCKTEFKTEIQQDLKSALDKVAQSKNFSDNAWILRKALDRTYNSLETKVSQPQSQMKRMTPSNNKTDSKFKVLLESKLPEGFPAPGPVNEVVVKEYPAYRAAKVEGSNMTNFSFMKLFGHIKKNNISMTAPVEMAIGKNDGKRRSMAFLYGNTNIGSVGEQSSGVNVIDFPSKLYVSIGIRGQESTLVIKESISKLEDWLAKNKDYSADGEHRLLGYNSPMVQASKRYWEVQVPVKRSN